MELTSRVDNVNISYPLPGLQQASTSKILPLRPGRIAPHRSPRQTTTVAVTVLRVTARIPLRLLALSVPLVIQGVI